MNTKDVLKHAADEAGMSMIAVSKAMGRNDNYMSVTMSRGSTPKADTLAAMLDVCGYDLAAVPRSCGLPDGSLVIDPPETNGK